MNKLLEINIDWAALLKIGLATLGSGGIGALIILWARHRKEDSAKARKTMAEAEEIEERSAMIKLQRDERIFEISTKLVEKLSQENETTRKELDSAINELHQVRNDLNKANKRCADLELSLEREKENNRICAAEMEQLMVELERLKRESNRRPN
jgi:acyl-homoserine lactone acylase PvdQ